MFRSASCVNAGSCCFEQSGDKGDGRDEHKDGTFKNPENKADR